MQEQRFQGYELSPQQKHLWLLQQSFDDLSYNCRCVVLIEGKLDSGLLEAALKSLVARHEILRTRFLSFSGMVLPLQVIGDGNAAMLKVDDISGLDAQAQWARIDSWFEQLGCEPVDFQNALPLKTTLIILSPIQHALLISLPAICSDSKGLDHLVAELAYAYRAGLDGECFTSEPVQYADVSSVLNQLIESEEMESGRAYWGEKNLQRLVDSKLPLENSHSQNSTFAFQSIQSTVASSLVTKIESLAELCNTEPAIFLLACWQMLLWRLTSQTEVTVSVAYDGRTEEELADALGLFTRYLPVECRLQEQLTFKEALKLMADEVCETGRWQDYFSWDQVDRKKGASAEAYFPYCFAYEHEMASYPAADLVFAIHKKRACVDRFKLKLTCSVSGDCLITEFDYDASLLPSEIMERMPAQFHTLLESAVTEPTARIDQLNILSPAERRQLVVDFNNTQKEFPHGKRFVELFEEQVERTPDHLAVVFDDQQLTYARLNARANQLARHLQRFGVGPEAIVAIYMERSVDMLLGLLAILKAGGAYLPLDIAYPKQRLAYMLEDAGSPVVLTHRGLLESLPDCRARFVCLDGAWNTIAQENEHRLVVRSDPQTLAYVIYTSGTTGKPKGTMITNRGLVNYLHWCATAYDVAAGGGAAVHSSISFDLTITGLLSPLIVGRIVHLLPENQGLDPLATALSGVCDFSLVKLTPMHLEALSLLLDEGAEVKRVKRFIVGGEALFGETLSFWATHAPATIINNEYGPTETVVGCCSYEISAGRCMPGSVPIGRPISNMQLYVMDRHLQPVPAGVIGNLYISGEGLARGYLNQRELTAEKFIPNPRNNAPGSRLYVTGDLARFLSDGNLEFLGRADHQVKIRGYRLELGEIEATLRQHAAVRDAVALAEEDSSGHKKIVMYITVIDQNRFDPSMAREFLAERLPEYMLPSTFVLLDEMPLTTNGKVDRQALPAAEQVQSNRKGKYVAPRTDVERTLAKIWADVLRLEQVSIDDSFFELGGDSILSLQITSRARRAGLVVSPQQIFQHRTITDLAAVASPLKNTVVVQSMVSGAAPLTPIQRWFFEQEVAEEWHYNQAVMLEGRQEMRGEWVGEVYGALVEQHDALRLRFREREGVWEQEVEEGEKARREGYTEIDLREVSEERLGEMIEAAAERVQRSLDLERGPMTRLCLFAVDNGEAGARGGSRVLMVIHHLGVDGVSWRVLLEDLQLGYEQLARGEAVRLLPATLAYTRWAERLAEYAQSAEPGEEIGYWQRQAEQVVGRLPVAEGGGPGEASQRRVSGLRQVRASLSQEETRRLLVEVPGVYQTQIDEVLLSGLGEVLCQWAGAERLEVEMEGHGREVGVEGWEVSRTVGWFTSIYPVVVERREGEGVGERLKRVKEEMRRIPGKGSGYGVLKYLREEEGLRQRISRESGAEVLFNYLGQLDQVMEEKGLFKIARESSGASRCPDRKMYLLEINGYVTGGRLTFDWNYRESHYSNSTIEKLSNDLIQALRAIISHCSSAVGSYTPSDFPDVKLNQKALDNILGKLGQKRKDISK